MFLLKDVSCSVLGVAVFGFAACLNLTGCGSTTQQTASPEATETEPVSATTEPVPDGNYFLETLNGEAVLEGTQITLQFQDGRIAGSAGVNRYFAGVVYEAPNKLSIGPIGSTLMIGQEPEGIMQQEQAYLEALQKSAVFELQPDGLVLTSAASSDGTQLVYALVGDAE